VVEAVVVVVEAVVVVVEVDEVVVAGAVDVAPGARLTGVVHTDVAPAVAVAAVSVRRHPD
jgi:hypothetical protein